TEEDTVVSVNRCATVDRVVFEVGEADLRDRVGAGGGTSATLGPDTTVDPSVVGEHLRGGGRPDAAADRAGVRTMLKAKQERRALTDRNAGSHMHRSYAKIAGLSRWDDDGVISTGPKRAGAHRCRSSTGRCRYKKQQNARDAERHHCPYAPFSEPQ